MAPPPEPVAPRKVVVSSSDPPPVHRLAEPRVAPVGRRASLAVAAGLALFCLVWILNLGSAALPMALIWAPVLWLFLACFVFLLASIAGRFFGFVPEIPGLPPRLNGDPRLIAAAAAFLLLVTMLREGALAPTFVLNLNWWSATHQVNHNATSNSTSTGEQSYAGRAVHCQLLCGGDEVGCDVLQSSITCDDREPTPDGVSVIATVTMPEVSCYTPLAKSADTAFSANISLSASDAGGNKSSSLTIMGNARLEMTGLVSCYTFRQRLAALISDEVAGAINSHLSDG